jgi:hypothetical protein
MRKDKQQRKKPKGQLDLFRASTEPSGTAIGRTDGDFQAGVELSSRLEKQRTLTANLLTKILDYENLNRLGSGMVCPSRATIFVSKDAGVKVNRNRLVRKAYARWCGGTAVMSRFLPD